MVCILSVEQKFVANICHLLQVMPNIQYNGNVSFFKNFYFHEDGARWENLIGFTLIFGGVYLFD